MVLLGATADGGRTVLVLTGSSSDDNSSYSNAVAESLSAVGRSRGGRRVLGAMPGASHALSDLTLYIDLMKGSDISIFRTRRLWSQWLLVGEAAHQTCAPLALALSGWLHRKGLCKPGHQCPGLAWHLSPCWEVPAVSQVVQRVSHI